MFHLKFDIIDNWSEETINILDTTERIKEKYPDDDVVVEVSFKKTQKYKD